MTKAYIAITGTAFALMFIVHMIRLAYEGWKVFAQPVLTITTLISVAFFVWAIVLFRAQK
jgi:uncharacterized ion transporter superfamily protein YfcC